MLCPALRVPCPTSSLAHLPLPTCTLHRVMGGACSDIPTSRAGDQRWQEIRCGQGIAGIVLKVVRSLHGLKTGAVASTQEGLGTSCRENKCRGRKQNYGLRKKKVARFNEENRVSSTQSHFIAGPATCPLAAQRSPGHPRGSVCLAVTGCTAKVEGQGRSL